MPIVVGVRFKDSGKTYHFDPRAVQLAVGDWAIIDTVRGPELGRIAAAPAELPAEEILGDVRPVLRRATQDDMDRLAHLQQYVDEALAICAEKVAEHKLPMTLIKAEYNFDGSRLTFFFSSDKRVDFRALVRDLARTFHTRIELRQVGPRDEAKLLGGIGPCGRPLCCSTFLPDFARVSIKMAKDQDLPLNPIKISGVCGRLLCCLSYEHEQYLDIKAELPPRGAWVQTPDGPGEVVAVNVVRETVTVDLGNGNITECTAAQVLAVAEQVGAEARARNAEGITPVARVRRNDVEADVELLEALEDRPPPPPAQPLRLEAALAPTGTPSRQQRTDERRPQVGPSGTPQAQPEQRPQQAAPNRLRSEPQQASGRPMDGSQAAGAAPQQPPAEGTTQSGGSRRRRRGRGEHK